MLLSFSNKSMRNSYIEYCIASWAVFEGKNSLTATSLFSFFLSENCFCQETTLEMYLNQSFISSIDKKKTKKTFLSLNLNKDTVFKKASDLSKTMRWKLWNVSVVPIFWIIGTNCNDLIIFLSLFHENKSAWRTNDKEKRSCLTTMRENAIPDQSWAWVLWPWLEESNQEGLAPAQNVDYRSSLIIENEDRFVQ